jgi:hypothetical protein
MSTIVLHFQGGAFDGGFRREYHNYFPDGEIIKISKKKRTHNFWYNYASEEPYTYGEVHVTLKCVAITALAEYSKR